MTSYFYFERVGHSRANQKKGREYAIQRCGLDKDVSYIVAAQELGKADNLFYPYRLRNHRVAANLLAQAYWERMHPQERSLLWKPQHH